MKVQRRSGDNLDAMLASVEDEAEHWCDVALYAALVGEHDIERMALTRLQQLEAVCRLQMGGES